MRKERKEKGLGIRTGERRKSGRGRKREKGGGGVGGERENKKD